MGRKKGNSVVYQYLSSLERHFPYLLEVEKMKEATRESFFKDLLGCGPSIYNCWWNTGIRKIYFAILFLLDEIHKQRARVKELEKQLEEILKK